MDTKPYEVPEVDSILEKQSESDNASFLEEDWNMNSDLKGESDADPNRLNEEIDYLASKNVDIHAVHESDEYIAMVQEVFSMFDYDSDGKITTRDMPAVFRTIGYNPTEAEMKLLFEYYEDGDITLKQCMELLRKISHYVESEGQIEEAFRVFDKENKGVISVSEFRHIMTTMGEKLTDQETEDLIKFADGGNTGEIDYKAILKNLLANNSSRM